MTRDNPVTFVDFELLLFDRPRLDGDLHARRPSRLMPDVTMKPLRSKANAIINLMGTFGGILSIAILGVFALDSRSYVDYWPAFVAVGVLMLVFLALCLWKVKEPTTVAEKEADDIKYGLTEEDEVKDSPRDDAGPLPREAAVPVSHPRLGLPSGFIGYNAVTTKFFPTTPQRSSAWATRCRCIIAHQGAALVAFDPVGFLAAKIGRRKTILIGITILSICFASVSFITETTSLAHVPHLRDDRHRLGDDQRQLVSDGRRTLRRKLERREVHRLLLHLLDGGADPHAGPLRHPDGLSGDAGSCSPTRPSSSRPRSSRCSSSSTATRKSSTPVPRSRSPARNSNNVNRCFSTTKVDRGFRPQSTFFRDVSRDRMIAMISVVAILRPARVSRSSRNRRRPRPEAGSATLCLEPRVGDHPEGRRHDVDERPQGVDWVRIMLMARNRTERHGPATPMYQASAKEAPSSEKGN
ncbi:MAG: hypothetical protein MZU97_14380 [Bacillus subtilis]|nr:hypothetical protein [Bacillus subtilis]